MKGHICESRKRFLRAEYHENKKRSGGYGNTTNCPVMTGG